MASGRCERSISGTLLLCIRWCRVARRRPPSIYLLCRAYEVNTSNETLGAMSPRVRDRRQYTGKGTGSQRNTLGTGLAGRLGGGEFPPASVRAPSSFARLAPRSSLGAYVSSALFPVGRPPLVGPEHLIPS